MQQGIGLSNLVPRFGIADPTLFDLVLHLTQDFETLLVLLLDRVTQGFSYLRLKESRVQFKGPIEISRCLLPVLFVVLSEPAIEKNERKVVALWQTLQKLIVLRKIQVAVERRAVGLHPRVEFPCALTFRNGFLQFPGEPIGIAQFPMYFRMVGIRLERFSEQRHSLLH